MADTDTVEAYLASFDGETRARLDRLRGTILELQPDAEVGIRYGMPAYRFANGHPVYLAGWKQHVSIHDVPTLPTELEAELARWRSGKDTVKLPHRSAVPWDLLERVLRHVAT